jgi:hypothetical protein
MERKDPAKAEIVNLDSATLLGDRHRDAVVICGSHGGHYPALLAARLPVRAIILNDAGIGLESAGIAGLSLLDRAGVPAACVDYRSTRIGDAAHAAKHGVISHVNEAAAALGCEPGQRAEACAARLCAAAPARPGDLPPLTEARYRLDDGRGARRIWGLDSAALVRPQDAGQILIVGSHGGAPGGAAATALRVDAFAAVFNDAGVGFESAGLSRLPFLNDRGIIAATVSAATARIGDARSMWATGRLSYVNPIAERRGVAPGQSLQEFVRVLGLPQGDSAP